MECVVAQRECFFSFFLPPPFLFSLPSYSLPLVLAECALCVLGVTLADAFCGVDDTFTVGLASIGMDFVNFAIVFF